MRVLSEIKNRGTQDCLIVVCDGLTGLPEAIAAVWPQTIVQTCIVHLLRNSFKYASKKDWAVIARDLKPVYTAASESAALDAFAEFSEKWEKKYPAIIRLWTAAWAEFVPFFNLTGKSARSSAPLMRSKALTPGSGGRSTPEGTSRPKRPH
jgi:putative transposase